MEYLVPPWKHQLEAIRMATSQRDFAFLMDMGSGKTSTAINTLRHRFNENKRVLRTLILCPPIVVKNWGEEWRRHSKLAPEKLLLLTGPGSRREKLFSERVLSQPTGFVAVTNYEALLMKDLYEKLLAWKPEVLVLDESHKCKDLKAQRTKLAVKLADGARHRYLLSGSPVLNSPLDLFAQFRILDGGETFGGNFFAFRARFFRDKNAGMPKHKYFPNWVIRDGALEEINGLIFRKAMRVEKKDCLDLPPLLRQVIKVEMSTEQKRMYLEMKQDFLTFIEDKAVSAALAITKALRLQQIASGYAKTEDGKEITLKDVPKLAALKELLSELAPHHKVLVWACWRENYAQIRAVCEELGLKYVEVHGDVPAAKKYANVDQFNTDEQTRVFIGHPGSGGIGINLVVASYSIFYSRTFSLEHSLQAEARNHRGGSHIHDKITRIDLVTEGSIDELVMESLANKVEVSDKLLADWAKKI